MKNLSLWVTNILILSAFIWFLKWNSAPEEQVIIVKEITPVEEIKEESPSEDQKVVENIPEDQEPPEAVRSVIEEIMTSSKSLEMSYLKMENENLRLENLRLTQEIKRLLEEKGLELSKLSEIESKKNTVEEDLKNQSEIANKRKKEAQESDIRAQNLAKEKERILALLEEKEKDLMSQRQAFESKMKEEKEKTLLLFETEKKRHEEDFLTRVEKEVHKRTKPKEEPKVVSNSMESSLNPSISIIPNLRTEKKNRLSWDEMWSKIIPANPLEGVQELYGDNLAEENKKLLAKAYEEKIVDKVLWLHEQLSNSRKQLKSTMIKEVEMVKKEDNYSQTTDFLLNTGDRYIILSLSIPLEPAPYEDGKEEVFWVTAKVFDLDSEVLRFQLKLKDNRPTTEEIISYVPGDWIKILKSFK